MTSKTASSIPQAESPILHLQRQQLLLRMEYEYEKQAFRRQTEIIGVENLIQKGQCWFPVSTGRTYWNSLNQFVMEFMRPTDEEDTTHHFEYGKPVTFFSRSANGTLTYQPFQATVSYADETRMVVVLPGVSAAMQLQTIEMLGVQLNFDELSYRTMFEALEDMLGLRGGKRMSELRDILLGSAHPGFRELYPTRFPWLNLSQESAVNKVLCAKDVAIVHGPPGTGKTTTLVEAIYETLHREPQVLVCAQSNMAVDWIAEKLVDRGVNVLRIGNPSRVDEKMLSFTYERRFEAHPSYCELWGIRREIRQMNEQGRRRTYPDREAFRSRMQRLRDKATALELQINSDLLEGAHVIASTLVSSNHRLLCGRHFGTLFIDEATQALEAACWIAIRKAHRVILAGDYQQLPPTIMCHEAALGGLDRTLMQYVAERKPSCVSLLRIQYRMHRDIMQFPSRFFYNGQLEAAPEVSHRSILDWDIPITWINTHEFGFREKTSRIGSSRLNTDEAQLLVRELETYISRIGLQRLTDEHIDFGVISPYKAQVQHLRSLLRTRDTLRPLRHRITVNTVDGFQGQERDVIFISLVRANEEGNIGFLHDLRRINVAITRARMKLVILGDAPTLCRHPFYLQLMQYIESLNPTTGSRVT